MYGVWGLAGCIRDIFDGLSVCDQCIQSWVGYMGWLADFIALFDGVPVCPQHIQSLRGCGGRVAAFMAFFDDISVWRDTTFTQQMDW